MAQIGIIKNLVATHGSKKHEHSFRLEFVFEDKIKNDFVGGLDFHDINFRLDTVLQKLKDNYLPEVDNMGRGTVENLACYLIKALNTKNLAHITIWEDTNRYARIYSKEV